MSNIVIGIDLGTTNSCTACYRHGEIKILENEEGDRVTPSFLFFPIEGNVVVGKFALKMSRNKPEYSIYGIKRLVGRKFDDPYVKENLKYIQYTVSDYLNECVITIRQNDTTIQRTPQELCATILKKLKKDAESKLGEGINKAVITVPAYFNMKQREITMAAAQEAGFTVLKLLNEPTAAALNYYFDHGTKEGNYILVYDLGGGTFDVSILKGNVDNINILGVDGDTHLGGQDFDNLIFNYVLSELEKEYRFDPKSNRRLMSRLLPEIEDAKKTLSVFQTTTINLEGFVPDHDVVEIELTRQQFENMSNDLCRRTTDIVEHCLKSCNLKKSDIDQVILAGGSTRIPKIQEMLSAFFNGKEPNKFVNPDECVAVGAALQAAMLSTNPDQKIDKIKITDVTPLSLGTMTIGYLMSVFIKRNTPLPVRKTLCFVSTVNRQSSMGVAVYEGERTDVRKNRLLATIEIEDLTPAPPGQCEIDVTMSIDENGILTVKAKETLRNNVKELTILYTSGQRSDSDVQNALVDAEQNKEEDEKFVEFAYVKRYLFEYCEQVRYNLEEKQLVDEYKEIYEMCKEVQQTGKHLEVVDKRKLDGLIEDVTEKCEHIVKEHKFDFLPTLQTKP